MTRKTWTTKAQETWLKARVGNFATAEAADTRKAFFDEVTIDWQKEWPDAEPTEDDVKRAGNYEQAVRAKRKQQDLVSIFLPILTYHTYWFTSSVSGYGSTTISVLL